MSARKNASRRDDPQQLEDKYVTTHGKVVYREIFNAISDAIIVHDVETDRILDVNDAMLRLYGFGREEALKLKPEDLSLGSSPYSATEAKAWITKSLTEGPQTFEWRARRKNGELFWVEVCLKSTVIGEKQCLLVIIRDITERKLTEISLLKEKSISEAVINSLPGVFFMFDENGKIVRWNEEYARKLDASPEKVATFKILEHVAEDEKEKVAAAIEQLYKYGRVSLETEFKSEKGNRIPFHVSARKLQIGEHSFLIGEGYDISEQKRVENALRHSEEKYHAMVEQCTEAMALVDENGRIIEWNRASEIMTGIKRQFTIGKYVWDIHYSLIIPDRRTPGRLEELKKETLLLLQTGKSDRFTKPLENKFLRADGQVRVSIQNVFPIKTSKGYHIGSISNDITDRKVNENEIFESKERFRLLFENAADCIILMEVPEDEIPIIRDINNFGLQVLGYSKDELIGKSIYFLEEFADNPKSLHDDLKNRRKSANNRFEVKHRCKNGEYRVFECSINELIIGEKVFLLSVERDITEQKYLEQIVKDREFVIGSIFSVAPVGVSFAKDRILLKVNDSLCTMTGYDREEIEGKSARIFYFDQQDYEDAGRELFSLDKSRPKASYETRFRRKDSGAIYVLLTSAMMHPGDPSAGYVVTIQDITDRKLAEEQIKATVQRLNDIIEFLPDATFVVDNDKKIIAWNRAMEKMTGSKAVDMIGKGDYEYAIPFYGQRRPILIDYCDLPSSKLHSKYNYIKHDGEIVFAETCIPLLNDKRNVWLWGSASPLYDIKGQRAGAIEVIRDITERHRAEETLKESEERFRTLVESAPEGIIVHSEGRFRYLNPAILRIFGASRAEDLLDKDIFNSIAPECREAIKERIQIQKHTGRPVSQTEQEYLRMDGNRIWLETIAMPVKFENKDSHLVFLRDLTEKKKAELAIRESDEMVKRLFNSTPVGIILLSNRKIQKVNPSFCRMTGYSEDELLGKDTLMLYQSKADYDMVGDDIYSKLKHEGRAFIEFKFARKDKKAIDVLMQLNYIQADNPSAGVMAMIMDVTERKRVELENKRLEIQLLQSQKMESIGQLAGGIAHDINNQLAVILNYAQILSRKIQDEKLLEFVGDIYKSCDKAASLIKQLNAFARQSPIQKVNVDVHGMINEVIRMLMHSIDKRIKITSRLNADYDIVLGDPAQLHNAILNLAINSRDAMPDGGELMIETSVVDISDRQNKMMLLSMAVGKAIRISVSDTGCGISSENINRIFEPFFTTKPQGKGTGLGLAAVYGTIKSHNGSINVYSEVGKGTTINLYLPLSSRGRKNDAESMQLARPDKPYGILVIDDESMVLTSTSAILENLGYKVYLADSGSKGVSYYKKHKKNVDIILLDMNMPEMNGRQVYDKLKRIDPDVKVIITTGFSVNGDMEKLKESGIIFSIQKPYNEKVLADTIIRAMNNDT